MKLNEQGPKHRMMSKFAAIKYATHVGARDMSKNRITGIIRYLKHHGWHDEELTDLVVAQALWDDDSNSNHVSEVIDAIKSLQESVLFTYIKNVILESLLLEATCPSCGDPNAYHGFTKVECQNPRCDHYVEPTKQYGSSASFLPGNLKWMKKTHPDAYADWIDFCAQQYDPEHAIFDEIYGVPTALPYGSSKNYEYKDGSWSEIDYDDEESYHNYDGECQYCYGTGLTTSGKECPDCNS